MSEDPRVIADRYELGDLIGRGGMSEVYQGHDPLLGRDVAIKLLRPALSNDPKFRSRFRQEAQAAARMTHATVVKVFDAGEQTEVDAEGEESIRPYIVMELVEGELLQEKLAREGTLSEKESARIIGEVLTALEYSHKAGVVHRDVKPGNIMISPKGAVKVMDFGIARAASETAATVAETTAILGTAQYFSPEQATGEKIDERTDLYSAGVVLYEMLTGGAPFLGETAVAVAYQHVREAPEPPRLVEPTVSAAMDAVVLRALEKKPADRFASAAAFRAAVKAALKGEMPEPKVVDQAALPLAAAAVSPAGADDSSTDEASEAAEGGAPADEAAAAAAETASAPAAPVSGAPVAPSGDADADPLAAARALLRTGLTGDPTVAGTIVSPDDFDRELDAELAELLTSGTEAERAVSALSARDDAAPLTQKGPPPAWLWGGILFVGGMLVALIFWLFTLGPVEIVNANSVEVPELISVSEEDAVQQLEALGFEYTLSYENSEAVSAEAVTRTIPAGLQTMRPGSTVQVFISLGPPTIEIPDVKGLSIARATERLEAAGFTVGTRERSTSPDVREDRVMETSPGIGDDVVAGTTVNLIISNGRVDLPDLVGEDLADARSILNSLRLKVNPVSDNSCRFEGGSPIIRQSPGEGRVRQGATIEIAFCVGGN